MDPKANLERQRQLAREIIQITDAYDLARDGEGYEEEVLEPIGRDLAPELAELVQALDEWRLKDDEPQMVYIVTWDDDGDTNAQAYRTREAAQRDFGAGVHIVQSTVQS